MIANTDKIESHLLNPETLKYLQKVSEEYGVKRMLLFGSCLHIPEDDAGDIDLAVEGLEDTSIYDFVGELLLSKELKKQVHVVDLSKYTPIVPIVLEEGVIIYDKTKENIADKNIDKKDGLPIINGSD